MVIKIDSLSGFTKINFSSKNNSIDFLQETIHIRIYFNGALHPEYDFFPMLNVFESNQKDTHVFSVLIPIGNSSCVIIITDNKIGSDLSLIEANASY